MGSVDVMGRGVQKKLQEKNLRQAMDHVLSRRHVLNVSTLHL